ncbi:MAG: TonB-dependent receptor [Bacteroidetes bacterium]|nr:TonB-dependent receptor [Bacteroidota bacterium]
MLLSLLLLTTMWSADLHLHGIVRDSVDRTPVSGASVHVIGTLNGTFTNREGMFHLHNVDTSAYELDVKMVGYRRARVRIDRAAMLRGADVHLDVALVRDTVQAHEVVVQDHRSAQTGLATQNVYTLDDEEIENRRGQTFSEVLTVVPGVTLMSTGPSITKPVIHGMSSQRLVVMNAGVAQEGQQWGAEHGPEIDPFTPSTISVVRGPASVVYGMGAMGGVVNVEPRKLPSTSVLRGEASLNGFSNAWQGAMAASVEQGRLFGAPLAIRVQGSVRRAGDARTPDYALTNTGFKEIDGSMSVGYEGDSAGVVATVSLVTSTLGIYSGSHIGNPTDMLRVIERGGPDVTYPFSYTIDAPKQQIYHLLTSVRAYMTLPSVGTLKATYGWQQNNRQEYDAHYAHTTGPAMELLLNTYTGDVSLAHELLPSMQGTVGVNVRRQVNSRGGTVYLIPDYLAWNVGAYLLESYVLRSWTFSAGVRYDAQSLDATLVDRLSGIGTHRETDYASATASAGALLAVADGITLGANVGMGWRPPTVNELYSNDVHHGVAQYEIGDPNLVPERNTEADLTLTLARNGWNVEASVYANAFQHYIYAVPDPDNPTVTVRGTFPTFRYTQNAATIAGADVRASYQCTDVWQVYTTASMVRGTDQDQNVPLIFMPADRMRLGVHAHVGDVIGLHDVSADVSVLGVRTQDRYVAGADYAPPPPGYVLTDVTLASEVNVGGTALHCSLTCKNLFNVAYRDYLSRYRYFALDAGRDVVLRLTIPFGGS